MFKSIIKRIIVGVSVAVILLLMKKNGLLIQAHAQEISSVNNPFTTSNIAVVNNNTSTYDFDISGGNWANWGLGTLQFNFSIIKVSGASTDPIVVPSGITANTGASAYNCNIFSSGTNNSTWTGNTYTAKCNMKMGSSGLTKITFYLSPNQQNTTSTYRITIAPVITYEQYANSTINVDTSSTTNAINNQTQTITNNQTQNTQDIINNQNQNTEEIKNEINNSLNDNCHISKNLLNTNTAYGASTGGANTDIFSSNNSTITSISNTSVSFTTSANWSGVAFDYISIDSSTSYTLSFSSSVANNQLFIKYAYYDSSKSFLSDAYSNGNNTFTSITPNNARYIKVIIEKVSSSSSPITFSNIQLEKGTSSTTFEPYGQQVCGANKIDKVNDSINSVNNTLNNSDTDLAQEQIDSDFNDFDIETHGLTLVIGAPIRLFRSLLTNQCTALTIPLPFVNQNIVLPCMSTIYTQHFGGFLTLYRLITDGVIGYWVCIKTFKKVKDFLNPIDEKVEVFDL